MPEKKKVLLAVEISRSFGRALLRGIFRYSNLHGSWALMQSPFLLLQGSYFDQSQERIKSSILTYLQNNDVDGVIMRDVPDLKGIKALKMPAICVSYLHEEPGIASVQSDCDAIGKLAAQHFLDRRFRCLGYCGYDKMYWSNLRKQAFKEAIENEGGQISIYKQPKLKKDRLWTKEQHFVADWLISLPKPVGILACNDERAREVIEACMLAGLRIPEDIAVLGVDNDDIICEMADEPISSIAMDVHQAGYDAAELLDKMMNQNKLTKQKVVIKPDRVVVRHSTDILAVDDEYVREAIKFIRQHIHEPIQVTDVARAIALSRTAVYDKFQKAIGYSVHQCIKQMRVDEIARLLIESEMNIAEIAFAMGFSSEDHIAQYFRKNKGVNPSKYRKQFR